MINRKHKLSLVKQCETLDITRSGLYYKPKPVNSLDVNLMRLIDEIHLNQPFLDTRRIIDAPHDEEHQVNYKRVGRLMRKMGIEAIYPKPNLNKSNPHHRICP